MRKLMLTATMASLIVSVVLAQRPGGFGGFGGGMGGMMSGDTLLGMEVVQKELKLTDEQKKSITEATEARTKAFAKAREDMDFSGLREIGEEYTKALGKVRSTLSAEQRKRLLGIEVQVAVKQTQPAIFKNQDVVKALKLSEKQTDMVKESLTELDKDVKEIRDDAGKDFRKMRETMTKVNKLNKDTFEKITKSLSEEQQKNMKELQGDEVKIEFPNMGKGTKKKDDF